MALLFVIRAQIRTLIVALKGTSLLWGIDPVVPREVVYIQNEEYVALQKKTWLGKRRSDPSQRFIVSSAVRSCVIRSVSLRSGEEAKPLVSEIPT